jgi:hypothetical protein
VICDDRLTGGHVGGMMHSETGSGIGSVFAGSPRNRLVQLFVVVAFAPMMLLGGVAYSSAESALCSQLGGQLTTTDIRA